MSRQQQATAGPDVDAPGGVYTQTGIHAFIPIWILSPSAYLPGANPEKLKPGDEKPLNNSEIRVYIALRSFADRYTGHAWPFVKTIAGRAEVHPHSAEKALAKFERLGWLTKVRRYKDSDKGQRWIHRCDYYLVDVCPEPPPGGWTLTAEKAEQPEGGTRETAGRSPRDDGYSARETAGAKNTPDEHPKGTHQETDLSCVDSDRFAHSADGARTQQSDLRDTQTEHAEATTAAQINGWRRQDREVFRMYVGDVLVSLGHGWGEGRFTADAFYTAFRKKKSRIRWPGRMLEGLYADGGEQGIDDWLLDQGLERAV